MKKSIYSTMKNLMIVMLTLAIAACGGASEQPAGEESNTPVLQGGDDSGPPSYDPKRGEGKFTEVEVGSGLDVAMATAGENVANLKCASCHKMTDERLVGPGWKGVTSRRTLPWLMNFITNPDPMIDKDPELQAQLEICLVRMPNQNLADQEAREIVEYMRKIDGVQ